MTGRPRTSTFVLTGLFLAVLALYILVRPVPVSAVSPEPTYSPASHAQPRAVCSQPHAVTQPHAVSQPVSDAAREPFVYADYYTHTQPVTIGHLAQPVTVRGIAHIQPAVIPAPPGVRRRDRQVGDPVEARPELADAARRAFDWIGSVAVDGRAAGIAGWLARLRALNTRPGTPPIPARPGPSWL